MDSSLQVVILRPLVQLVLEPNDLLQLSDLPVCFVTDERAVEVDGEHNKNESKRHHDAGGSDGRRLTGAYSAVVFRVVFEGQELHPAQEHHLCEEEEGANDCGKSPGQFYVAVHTLMGRLVDRIEVVNVADGLKVREDTGADHEGKQVHCNQNRGAGAEGYEQPRRIHMIRLQLYLHHGNHRESRQKSWSAAGGF